MVTAKPPLDHPLYLPANRDGVNKAVFAIDTSGSVTYYPGAGGDQGRDAGRADEGIIDEVVVLYGDVR